MEREIAQIWIKTTSWFGSWERRTSSLKKKDTEIRTHAPCCSFLCLSISTNAYTTVPALCKQACSEEKTKLMKMWQFLWRTEIFLHRAFCSSVTVRFLAISNVVRRHERPYKFHVMMSFSFCVLCVHTTYLLFIIFFLKKIVSFWASSSARSMPMMLFSEII